MSKATPTRAAINTWITSKGEWHSLLSTLRSSLLTLPLDETVKWGTPCYSHAGTLVVGLVAFKSYAGLWFYQGALLDDPLGVLISPQVSTKAQRQWRFDQQQRVDTFSVLDYTSRAITLAKQGARILTERGKPVDMPQALLDALVQDAKLAKAFDALSLTRKREYAEHITLARTEDTVEKRMARILPWIQAGRGLNDKYRG